SRHCWQASLSSARGQFPAGPLALAAKEDVSHESATGPAQWGADTLTFSPDASRPVCGLGKRAVHAVLSTAAWGGCVYPSGLASSSCRRSFNGEGKRSGQVASMRPTSTRETQAATALPSATAYGTP